MERFVTGIALVRKTLDARNKFQRLVDVKVRGYNRQYAGQRPPLRRPTTRWLDSLVYCLLSPTAFCRASCSFGWPSLPKSPLLRSVMGLVTGILLTWIYLWALRDLLRTSRAAATAATVCLLPLISLGLAFYPAVRRLLLVSVATLCSSTGRAIIYVYIVLLLSRGPVSNVIDNAAALGQGTACAGQQAQRAVKRHAEEVVQKLEPVAAVYQNVEEGMNKFLEAAEKKAQRVRKAAKAVSEAVEDLTELLPDLPDPWWLKSMKYNASWQLARLVLKDYIDAFVNLMKELLMQQGRELRRKLRTEANKTLEVYRVKVKIHRQLTQNISYQDKDWSEVMGEVAADMRQQTQWLWWTVQLLCQILQPFLAVWVLVNAALYIRSYNRKLYFDNVYITRRIMDIDQQRANRGEETLLPLPAGDKKYMNPLSLQLTDAERSKLFLGLLLLASNAACAAAYLMADWSFYQSASLVAKHRDDVHVTVQRPQCPHVNETGSDMDIHVYGPLAKLCESPDSKNQTQAVLQNAKNCFAVPTEPDYDVYRRIALLLVICLITTLVEAYTLRLRHTVCDYFAPGRADQRAGWFYNTAMASRGSFTHFLSQRMKAQIGVPVTSVSLKQRLLATVPCMRLFLHQDSLFCNRCSRSGDETDEWQTCDSCGAARFCSNCQSFLTPICPVCEQPIRLLHQDVSLEEDSDGEPPAPLELQPLRKHMQRLGLQFAQRLPEEAPNDGEYRSGSLAFPSGGRSATVAADTGVGEEELGQMSDRARNLLREAHL